METQRDILVTDRLGEVPTDAKEQYLAHLLCLSGCCTYRFNEKDYRMQAGDLSIIRKRRLVENVWTSEDFACKIIYVSASFVELCTPQSNYGIKGSLALFLNPIIPLDEEQQRICLRDFETLEQRVRKSDHLFYRETLTTAMQTAILDFYDFHARLYGVSGVSAQNATLMSRFLALLEQGAYRTHREIGFYADNLCVTPKYLSEVSKKVSGYAANHWINRYTVLDLRRLLRDKSLTLTQISDMFAFSSPAYFSRYVQQNLGIRPSDYRK